jgi:hypothetical protein
LIDLNEEVGSRAFGANHSSGGNACLDLDFRIMGLTSGSAMEGTLGKQDSTEEEEEDMDRLDPNVPLSI